MCDSTYAESLELSDSERQEAEGWARGPGAGEVGSTRSTRAEFRFGGEEKVLVAEALDPTEWQWR